VFIDESLPDAFDSGEIDDDILESLKAMGETTRFGS